MLNEKPSFKDWFITDAPKTLDDIYGQDLIVRSLKQDFKLHQFPKTTFFTGNFGSGKTAIAKILIKAMVCRTPLEDGHGCGKCPSCLAVENEQWNRDVTYINSESMSAQDVRDTVEKSLLVPATRDAAKVFFIEEAQALSPQAIEAFLIATQSPLPNTFFIFTAMEKLQGKKSGALESRSRKWKMQIPTNQEIYKYLGKFATQKKLVQDKDIPIDFWKEGLKTLAENSENSYRKALQLLQQCIDSKIYDVNEIKTLFDFNAEEDTANFLLELSQGKVSDNIRQVMIGREYQEKFNLMIDMLGNAKIAKLFGNGAYDDPSDWRNIASQNIAKGPYFEDLCELFLKLSSQTYIKKGDFKLIIGQLVSKIKENSAPESAERLVVRRRAIN